MNIDPYVQYISNFVSHEIMDMTMSQEALNSYNRHNLTDLFLKHSPFGQALRRRLRFEGLNHLTENEEFRTAIAKEIDFRIPKFYISRIKKRKIQKWSINSTKLKYYFEENYTREQEYQEGIEKAFNTKQSNQKEEDTEPQKDDIISRYFDL